MARLSRSTKELASPLLLLGLLLRLVHAQNQRQCYFPDGTPSSDSPCNTGADVSACCGAEYDCTNTGVCNKKGTDYNSLVRGSCTDKSWGSGCPGVCLGSGNTLDGPENIWHCVYTDNPGNTGWYYCNATDGLPDCDNNNPAFLGNFYLGPMQDEDYIATTGAIASTYAFPVIPSSMTVATNAGVTTVPVTITVGGETVVSASVSTSTGATSAGDGVATATGTTSSDNSTGGSGGGGGSSTGAAVGGAVGGVAALLIIAGIGFLLWRRHNKKKKAAARNGENQEKPADTAGQYDYYAVGNNKHAYDATQNTYRPVGGFQGPAASEMQGSQTAHEMYTPDQTPARLVELPTGER